MTAVLPDNLQRGDNIPKKMFMDNVDFSSPSAFALSLRDRLNITDAILETETVPAFIQRGRVVYIDDLRLNEIKMFKALVHIMAEERDKKTHARERYAEDYQCDFSIKCEDNSMVRVHAYLNESGEAVSIRIQQKNVIPFEQLGLPSKVLDIFDSRQGLVIFGGPVRSGKTNVLHSILEHRNQNGPKEHNIIIADPPEFLHEPHLCKITTREIGVTARSYSVAMRGALRVAHHLLVIGEMRGDRETTEAILHSANLGSLCATTAHTNTVAQTIRRFTNVFQGGDADMFTETFAQNVKLIMNLRLVPNLNGGETLAHEILAVTQRTESALTDTKQIKGLLDTQNDGITHSLEKHLAHLHFVQKIIDRDTMERFANDKQNLESLIEHRDYELA